MGMISLKFHSYSIRIYMLLKKIFITQKLLLSKSKSCYGLTENNKIL